MGLYRVIDQNVCDKVHKVYFFKHTGGLGFDPGQESKGHTGKLLGMLRIVV